MNKKFYITTPIYYPSADLHVGHAYTTVAGDVISRYKKTQGYEVFYLTGTDEHGLKIQQKAEEAGVTPKEFVDDIVSRIKLLWNELGIEYDRFIRTTDLDHEKAVAKIFDKMMETGDIYKGDYEGYYCVPCESFFTETQLKNGKCPDCGREVSKHKEESYFFKMSKYSNRLLEYYNDNPGFIQPESRKNEMINNFLKPGLEDLSITRTSFDWGIKVNDDPEHVVYVWLDALMNYVTALGYESNNQELFDKFWPADVHLVGKEIVRFHTIYWPIFLMSLDLPLPKKVFAHGWLLMKDGKMSKSKGNVVNPQFLINEYGLDTVRYFLMREVSFGSDGLFTPEAFIERMNGDLANDLGNMISRVLNMIVKYYEGVVPESDKVIDENNVIDKCLEKIIPSINDKMDNFEFSKALEDIWEYLSLNNKYIDLTKPWTLSGENDEKLASVLNRLFKTLIDVSILINPVMPSTSEKIKAMLNINYDFKVENIGNIDYIGATVTKPKPMFPRLNVDDEVQKIKAHMNGDI